MQGITHLLKLLGMYKAYIKSEVIGKMAELADATDLKSVEETRVGSNPAFPTGPGYSRKIRFLVVWITAWAVNSCAHV